MFPADLPVGQMYEITMLSMLRFYLATTCKPGSDDEADNSLEADDAMLLNETVDLSFDATNRDTFLQDDSFFIHGTEV